jgi:hypothetical protein
LFFADVHARPKHTTQQTQLGNGRNDIADPTNKKHNSAMAAMISRTRAAKHQTHNTNKHWSAMAAMIARMQAHATQQKQTYFGNGRNDIADADTLRRAGPNTQTNTVRQWPQ